MNLRNVLIACVLLGVLAWWYSSRSSDTAKAPITVSTAPGCPLPPRVRTGEAPLQTERPGALEPFRHAAASLDPLAGFSLEARILSREDYRMGREADLSPTDLALGWERMRDEAVVSQLKISQSSR